MSEATKFRSGQTVISLSSLIAALSKLIHANDHYAAREAFCLLWTECGKNYHSWNWKMSPQAVNHIHAVIYMCIASDYHREWVHTGQWDLQRCFLLLTAQDAMTLSPVVAGKNIGTDRSDRELAATFPHKNSEFFKLISKTPHTTTLLFFWSCNEALWVKMSDISRPCWIIIISYLLFCTVVSLMCCYV